MSILDMNGNAIPDPEDNALPNFRPTAAAGELVGIKVVTKKWSQVKAIFSETGHPTSVLLRALKEGHGITINDTANPKDDGIDNPFLFFVVSEEQMKLLKKHEIDNPTFLQLLGTCECVDTNQERAVQRYRELKGDPRA